jgi:predicted metal-dependent hydrolase
VQSRVTRKNTKQYLQYKEVARVLAKSRLAHYNTVYGFTINRVAIKNAKSRWGSCSKKGNLNFNYKIALLPLELADYVIVHELCHLGEFNHSPQFWKLVEKTLPNYKEIKNKFKGLRL